MHTTRESSTGNKEGVQKFMLSNSFGLIDIGGGEGRETKAQSEVSNTPTEISPSHRVREKLFFLSRNVSRVRINRHPSYFGRWRGYNGEKPKISPCHPPARRISQTSRWSAWRLHLSACIRPPDRPNPSKLKRNDPVVSPIREFTISLCLGSPLGLEPGPPASCKCNDSWDTILNIGH